MRILVATALYDTASPSGENAVFYNEVSALRRAGHRVDTLVLSNERYSRRGLFGQLLAVLEGIWSFRARRLVRERLKNGVYDVAHVHNTFPALSFSLVLAILKSRVPVFMTLHNYRYFCIKGITFRNGAICTLCLDKRNPIGGLLRRCYRKSFFAGLPSFLNAVLFRVLRFGNRKNLKFVALTEFQKQLITSRGLIHSDRIIVKPHFEPFAPQMYTTRRSNTVLFVGRFSDEKGIAPLLREWKLAKLNGFQLDLVGDGPLLELINQYARSDPSIRHVGRLSPAGVRDAMSRARLVVFPSVCLETFGLTIIEAYSTATPVVATGIGSNSDLVKEGQTGFLYNPFLYGDGARVFASACANLERLDEMGKKCFEEFSSHYVESVGTANLERIYGHG